MRIKPAIKRIARTILPVSLYRRLLFAWGDAKREVSAFRSRSGGVVRIPGLVLCVGQACNFKCRDCGNFAPYSSKDNLRYCFEDIRKSLEILFETGCQIEGIQVQGGEPFCYSDLPALLNDLGAKKQDGRIRNLVIATNGSIMPSDTIFQILQRYNIEIRISDYNIAHEKAMVFARQCKERRIRYTFYDFSSAQGQWYNLGGRAVERENSNAVVEDRYAHCAFRNCLTLEDGKLAYCSRALNAQGIQGFSGVSGDYLEISARPGFREELCTYLGKPHFMEACRYCNGTQDDNMIPCAIQIGSEK